MKKTTIRASLTMALLFPVMTPVEAEEALPCNFIEMNMPAEPGEASDALAEKAAKGWMACMGSRPIVIANMELDVVLVKTPSESNAPLPYYLRRNEGPLSITVGLKGRILASMDADEIERLIDFVATDGIPMPGLEVDHWRVIGRPPSSQLSGVFKVVDVTKDGFTLNIDTELYAIYGRDNRATLRADAPSPEHTYFNFEKKMKLEMTIGFIIDGF